MERGGSMTETIMTISLIGLVTAVFIWRIVREQEKCEMEKMTKQMKIDKLERELEELKGFPLVKVEEINKGEVVSIADSIYLCLDMKSPHYEKLFFDLNKKKIISISYNEKVRKRKDIEEALYKTIGVR